MHALVKELCHSQKVWLRINATLITLIPKLGRVDNPNICFQSIYICDFWYKIISLVIVNFLKPLLNNNIYLEKTCFIERPPNPLWDCSIPWSYTLPKEIQVSHHVYKKIPLWSLWSIKLELPTPNSPGLWFLVSMDHLDHFHNLYSFLLHPCGWFPNHDF